MRNQCNRLVLSRDKKELSEEMKSRYPGVEFMMPLVHVCCKSNKARCGTGYLTRAEFEPGKLANPASWFKPAGFESSSERLAQADLLASLDIVSIFLRFESGHSNHTAQYATNPSIHRSILADTYIARHKLA